MRYLLVDGQGNFGSIDGDRAAAMRYTEARMSRMASELLSDLDKETVEFVPNYDETLSMPAVLPTRVPNLLVNGSSGIAVGMATNIPPHNLSEVVDGCLALLDDPGISVDGLMEFIQGPGLPHCRHHQRPCRHRSGLSDGPRPDLRAGPGRGGAQREDGQRHHHHHRDPVSAEQGAPDREDRRAGEGQEDRRHHRAPDESDKDGLRVVIELRRGEPGEVVLNNLYAQTQLQSVFGINCVALVDDQPRVLNLKQMLEAFIQHRREVITRRTIYLLRRARQRGHILEGQAVALANIDTVIELIKASPASAEARQALMGRGWASEGMQVAARAGRQRCLPARRSG